MSELLSGLLVLDKPSGPTSFDCVQQVQRMLGTKRVGHCGTLDPLAEGVLVLLLGTSTRLQDQFLGLEKQYWFRAEWGRFTTTGDREGETLETRSYADVTRERLEEVAEHFVGDLQQAPPRISALKYKGKRLYQWAREGVDVPRPPRPVHIRSFKILAYEGIFWEGRVMCSRGTYIRSLVEDVARALGTGSTVDALVRERVGPFTREQGISWDRLRALNRDALLNLAQDPSLCVAL